MSKNGHNGDGLPGSLAAFMLSHLKMPEAQDYPRPPCPPEPVKLPEETTRTTSYETRTIESNSEIPAVIKAMKETGCAHGEIKEVVAILANKHQPSYDNRTSLVRESDAELKLRRKKEYDKAYQKRRYEARARDPELKILVRDKNSEVSIKEVVIDTEEVDKKKKVRASIVYSKEFDSFWLSYPRTPSMGKFEAWKVWQKLPAEERALAAGAVPKFVAWLKTQKADYPVVHACRFLSKKRFDGFQTPVAKTVDFKSEEYQRARQEALNAIKGT